LQSVTFAELATLVAAQARELAGSGLGRGARVALRVENTSDGVVDVLAVMATGATAVLLDPQDAAERTDRLVCQVGATWVDEHRSTAGALPLPPVPDDEAAIVFTSGSTGLPQAVALSHRNLLANASDLVHHHSSAQRSGLATPLPLFHVNALGFGLVASLVAGSPVTLLPGFDPLGFGRQLAAVRPGIISVVPSLLGALTRSRHRVEMPDSVRYFVSAAAPLPPATARAVHDRFGIRVVQGYGMSEATNFSCTMPVDLGDDAYRRLVLGGPAPVGIALPGNEVAILGPGDAPVAPGDYGDVCVRGENVMLGYVGDAAATAEVLRGGWLRTGDIGSFLLDPSVADPLLVLSGRAKNVVKVSGASIGLEEIEACVLDDPLVVAAVAVGVPDPITGEAVVVAVVPAGAGLDPARVQRGVQRRLGLAYVPASVRLVKSVPLLRNGKLDRRAVRAQIMEEVAVARLDLTDLSQEMD